MLCCSNSPPAVFYKQPDPWRLQVCSWESGQKMGNCVYQSPNFYIAPVVSTPSAPIFKRRTLLAIARLRSIQKQRITVPWPPSVCLCAPGCTGSHVTDGFVESGCNRVYKTYHSSAGSLMRNRSCATLGTYIRVIIVLTYESTDRLRGSAKHCFTYRVTCG